jgi:HEAT repeat protein
MNTQDIKNLVNNISKGLGSYSDNIEKLREYGELAIIELLNVESKHISGVRDGRDSVADILGAIAELSKENFEFVLDLFEKELAKPYDKQKYVSPLAWSLGSTGNQNADQLLAKCLKHKDMWTRWMCCESLLKLKSEKSIPSLIGALKDRSEMVKATAIAAMQEFGTIDAIPALKRLSRLKNKALAEKSLKAIESIKIREVPGRL